MGVNGLPSALAAPGHIRFPRVESLLPDAAHFRTRMSHRENSLGFLPSEGHLIGPPARLEPRKQVCIRRAAGPNCHAPGKKPGTCRS